MNRLLPSYPLFIKDPNFSLWMPTEKLNECNVQTWFGESKYMYGFLKTKGETFCFLGNAEKFAPFQVKKAVQTKLEISAFSTIYEFMCGKTILKLLIIL